MPRRAAAATVAAPTPQTVQAKINARWPGAMKFASDESFEIRRLPTGILALDAMMKGGLARGRHTELFGGYNVGKTAVTFDTIATSQRAGLECSFIDVEGTFDPQFAQQHGVDLGDLSLTDQYTLEQGNRVIDYIEAQLRSRAFDVIVLDSIAALLPKAEQEASMDDATMGTAQAKLMSAALRKLTAANKHTVLIYINQTRQKIGVTFGKKSITSGGLAMGFYAGTRLEFVRTENIKRKIKKINQNTGSAEAGTEVKGHRVLVRCEKDKTGATFQSEETTLVYDYQLGGFDPVEDLMYLGRKYGLIKKSQASWWLDEYPEDKQNGRGKFKSYLRNNDAIAEELKESIEAIAYSEEAGEIDDDADDDDE